MDGLIGHTGFVGSNLVQQHNFDRFYNSANIGDLAGSNFDTLVCAAAPGSMFEANRFPERDAERISTLISQLDAVGSVQRFVLISTVAVLAGFAANSEDEAEYESATPYGVNRRRLEVFVTERFPNALIVRLPALFGTGLKKNFLFDLLNPLPSMVPPAGLEQLESAVGPSLSFTLRGLYPLDDTLGMHVVDRAALNQSPARGALETAVADAGLTALRFTNPESQFQFYDMRALWRDIERGLENTLNTLHLAPQPLSASQVHRAITGQAMPENSARVHCEDMRTAHAALWGQAGGYTAAPAEIISQLREFCAAERALP